MKRKTILSMFAVIVVLSVWLVSPSMAEIKNTFVRLDNGVPGVLYEPMVPGDKSHIGILEMHTEADHLTFSAGPELATRGYRVLCANTSTSKRGFISDDDEDTMILNVSKGVAYLRKYPGIQKVVLIGQSGGGGLMTIYQNIAQNGVSACNGPEKIIKCPDSLKGLPAADGLILLDSTFGTGGMSLFSLDPAVVSEEHPQVLNPRLDSYNPENGFDPNGSTYNDKFVKRFFYKTQERMNELIDKALHRLEKINAGKGRYTDDEPFVVTGGSYKAVNNRLFMTDLRFWAHTRNPYPLLTKDGETEPQIIYSVRVPKNTASPTPSLNNGALTTSVRRFLSTFAVRANKDFGYDEDSIYGIDYESSYDNTPGAIDGVTVPLLQLGMTGSHEYFMSETIFERAQSVDKTLAYVEGASHGLTTCTACEQYPGEFGNTLKTTYDYVDSWLSKPGRFLP